VQPPLGRRGRERRIDRCPGEPGEDGVVVSEGIPDAGEFLRQRGADASGDVRVHRDGQPGFAQQRQRMGGERRHEAEGDIRGRAHFQGNGPLPDVFHQRRVIQRPDPMPEPLGVADRDRLPDALRPANLAGMMHQVQARVLGGIENLGERPDGVGLVAGHADADHTVICVSRGQPEGAPGPVHRPPPGMVEDHLAFDAMLGLPLGQAGQHRLQGHLQVAKPFPVGGSGEGDLGVAGALRGFVGAEFSRDPGEVLRPAQAVPDQRVVVGERAEAGVADRAVTRVAGDGHAVAGGDLAESGRPDRALQVNMQMGLGQEGQIAHGPQNRRPGPTRDGHVARSADRGMMGTATRRPQRKGHDGTRFRA
jgi:hypothetical protein